MRYLKDRVWLRCGMSLLSALVWTACGRQGSNDSATSSVNPPRPLVVVMGGNSSCKDASPLGMDMYPLSQDFVGMVRGQYGADPRYVVTCHTSTSDVLYVSDATPSMVAKIPLAKITEVVRQAMEPGAPVVLVGHSYGGWLAMKLALAMPDVRFAQIATIDPISRANCSFLHPSGCQSAPQDVTREQRLAIKARTGVWNNFFQVLDPVLHSSKIDEADRNYNVLTVHTGIDTAASVWDIIRRSTRLGAASVAQDAAPSDTVALNP